MKKVLILLFSFACIAGTSPTATVIEPTDIKWNPDFRSVSDAQIKLWSRPTILKQGKGVKLTQIDDSTILIDVVALVNSGGTNATIPTTPATGTDPFNDIILNPGSPRTFGILTTAPGESATYNFLGSGNAIKLAYAMPADLIWYHGSVFRNGPFSLGATMKAIAVEPSKPALVLEASPTQSAYIFAWTGPTGDTLGGIDKTGNLAFNKLPPQYATNAAALKGGLKVGMTYMTGNALNLVR